MFIELELSFYMEDLRNYTNILIEEIKTLLRVTKQKNKQTNKTKNKPQREFIVKILSKIKE